MKRSLDSFDGGLCQGKQGLRGVANLGKGNIPFRTLPLV